MKYYLWWQCPKCLWFDWVPVDVGQPLCPNCMKSLMLAHPPEFQLSDEEAARLPHLGIRPTQRALDAACACGSQEFYTDKVLGVVCCRCQAPRQ